MHMGVEQGKNAIMMLRGTERDPVIGALATAGSVERDGTVAVHSGDMEVVDAAKVATPEAPQDITLRQRVGGALQGMFDKLAS